MKKRDMAVSFLATRVALIVVALAAVTWLPSIHGDQYQHTSDNPLIDIWYRWDAGFFTRIALRGYGWQVGRPTGDATFMPLYPLLMSLPLRLRPGASNADAVVVGVILSNVCLLTALLVFDALMAFAAIEPRRRRLAHWLFLLAPATVFFSSVYTESLFFLLSLSAIYAARRERWLIAGSIGFLAGATRVVGWTLIVPLMWEAWEQRGRSTTPSIARGVAALVPALALPIYAGLVGLAMQSPTAYFDISQAQWGQGLGAPWRAFAEFFNGPITLFGWTRSLVDLIFTLVFLALTVPACRIRIGYGLYLLAGILFPAASGTLSSMPRYVAVLFPAYLVLAQWMDGHRWRTVGVLAISALLAALFAARFVTWRWIA